MSAALDLDDLEGAREEIGEAIVQIARVLPEHPSASADLMPALIGLGSAFSTLMRAIEAYGEARPEERRTGDGR